MNSHFSQLPKPEAGYDPKWDERFQLTAEASCENVDCPKLSIVTPSFNQGRFIERTIRCILQQGYPNLEYIIIDGGSTDETLRVIEKYEPWISSWISEPDTGMYDAINKGFERSTGEIMAWSPTGDLYEPNALNIIGHVFRQQPQVDWLTSLYKVKCDESGSETARYQVDGFSRRAFQKGLNYLGGNPYARYMIQQQSTFWKRSLWDRCGGGMDDSMKGAGDFELWTRFFSNDTKLYALNQPIGVFRSHDGQESVQYVSRMKAERELAFRRTGGKHMGMLEGRMRKHVLRRRPFSYLKNLPPFGFRSDQVSWDKNNNVSSIHVSYFI